MKTRECSICHFPKPIIEFYLRNDGKRGRHRRRRECIACFKKRQIERDRLNANVVHKRQSAYRKEHKQYHNLLNKQKRLRLKLQSTQAYGGKCACCGEPSIFFLAIDHVNGRSADAHHVSMVELCRLRRLNWPKEAQLLCHSCNTAKAIYGSCPHTWSDEKRALYLEMYQQSLGSPTDFIRFMVKSGLLPKEEIVDPILLERLE
jgi:hypothetical protein